MLLNHDLTQLSGKGRSILITWQNALIRAVALDNTFPILELIGFKLSNELNVPIWFGGYHSIRMWVAHHYGPYCYNMVV